MKTVIITQNFILSKSDTTPEQKANASYFSNAEGIYKLNNKLRFITENLI